jgi:hypothetical protein
MGADFFRLKTPKGPNTTVFSLNKVEDFNVMASTNVKDVQMEAVDQKTL